MEDNTISQPDPTAKITQEQDNGAEPTKLKPGAGISPLASVEGARRAVERSREGNPRVAQSPFQVAVSAAVLTIGAGLGFSLALVAVLLARVVF